MILSLPGPGSLPQHSTSVMVRDALQPNATRSPSCFAMLSIQLRVRDGGAYDTIKGSKHACTPSARERGKPRESRMPERHMRQDDWNRSPYGKPPETGRLGQHSLDVCNARLSMGC
jgi:hypothetical protein